MSSIQSIFVCRVSEFAFSLCLPEVLMAPNHLSVNPLPSPLTQFPRSALVHAVSALEPHFS